MATIGTYSGRRTRAPTSNYYYLTLKSSDLHCREAVVSRMCYTTLHNQSRRWKNASNSTKWRDKFLESHHIILHFFKKIISFLFKKNIRLNKKIQKYHNSILIVLLSLLYCWINESFVLNDVVIWSMQKVVNLVFKKRINNYHPFFEIISICRLHSIQG